MSAKFILFIAIFGHFTRKAIESSQLKPHSFKLSLSYDIYLG